MSIILPKQMIDDRDFFEQLLNESYNPEKGVWVRSDQSTVPVDFRDCTRYGRAAAEVYTNGNWARIPETRAVLSIKTDDATAYESINRSGRGLTCCLRF